MNEEVNKALSDILNIRDFLCDPEYILYPGMGTLTDAVNVINAEFAAKDATINFLEVAYKEKIRLQSINLKEQLIRIKNEIEMDCLEDSYTMLGSTLRRWCGILKNIIEEI